METIGMAPFDTLLGRMSNSSAFLATGLHLDPPGHWQSPGKQVCEMRQSATKIWQ